MKVILYALFLPLLVLLCSCAAPKTDGPVASESQDAPAVYLAASRPLAIDAKYSRR